MLQKLLLRVVQKTAEATGVLIENKIAEEKTKKVEEIYIPPQKWQQIIDDQFHCIKMKFQKIVNLLDITSDDKDLPRFVAKKWIEVYNQSGRKHRVNKEIRTKSPMLRSDYCDFSDERSYCCY